MTGPSPSTSVGTGTETKVISVPQGTEMMGNLITASLSSPRVGQRWIELCRTSIAHPQVNSIIRTLRVDLATFSTETLIYRDIA